MPLILCQMPNIYDRGSYQLRAEVIKPFQETPVPVTDSAAELKLSIDPANRQPQK